jgi:hypothetical protein
MELVLKLQETTAQQLLVAVVVDLDMTTLENCATLKAAMADLA